MRARGPHHRDSHGVRASHRDESYREGALPVSGPGRESLWKREVRLSLAALRAVPPAAPVRVLVLGNDEGLQPYSLAGAKIVRLHSGGNTPASRPESRRYHLEAEEEPAIRLSQQGVRPHSMDLVLADSQREERFSEIAQALDAGGALIFQAKPVEWIRIRHALLTAGFETFSREAISGDAEIWTARVGGRPQKLPPHLSRIDRTASVDRPRILEVDGARLICGPVVTRWVDASDPELKRASLSLIDELALQARSGRLHPARLELPAVTAREARDGEPGCDALCLLAHPDDEAVYLGGTLHRLATEGRDVRVVLATDGGAGRSAAKLETSLQATRRQEFEKARQALGIHACEELGFADGGKYRDPWRSEPVTSGDSLRLWGLENALGELVRAIRIHRPRTLLGFDPERDPNYSLHGHHLAMGVLALAAFHLAADPNSFPEQLGEGLKPWAVSRHLAVEPDHLSDDRKVRSGIDRQAKRQALEAHASQIYSTERLLTEFAEATPRIDFESFHLLQARDGGSLRAPGTGRLIGERL